MAYHIAVGIIAANKVIFAALHSVNNRVGNFCRFHPRALVKRNLVRGDFIICFKLFAELFASVTVPEISNVTVFLCFRNRVFVHALFNKKLCKSVFDFGRINKVSFGYFKVAVILKHTGVNNIWLFASVKESKIVVVKRHAQFKCAVAAEVEKNNAVAVNNFAYRLAVFGNNERRKVLVDNAAFFCAICFYSLFCRIKLSAFAQNVGFPAALYHIPVCLVSVHSDFHSAAARRDFAAEGAVVKL